MNPGLSMPFSVSWLNETWALLPWAWAILIYQISADWIKVQFNEVLFELSHSARVLLRAVTKSTSSPPPAMPLQKTGCYFVQNILALESSDLIVREKKLQLSTLFQKNMTNASRLYQLYKVDNWHPLNVANELSSLPWQTALWWNHGDGVLGMVRKWFPVWSKSSS